MVAALEAPEVNRLHALMQGPGRVKLPDRRYRQIDTHTDIKVRRNRDKEIDRQIYKQKYRQTDRFV